MAAPLAAKEFQSVLCLMAARLRVLFVMEPSWPHVAFLLAWVSCFSMIATPLTLN